MDFNYSRDKWIEQKIANPDARISGQMIAPPKIIGRNTMSDSLEVEDDFVELKTWQQETKEKFNLDRLPNPLDYNLKPEMGSFKGKVGRAKYSNKFKETNLIPVARTNCE